MAQLGRVVVIGNSFAGLLTARALADHATHVTIVDRDRIPDEPVARAGVPQARHIHVLLAGGQRALESLLPGVLDELSTHAVPAIDHPRDIVQFNRGQWVPRWHGGVTMLTGTRPLVEHVVRQRVLTHPRIDTLDAIEVVALLGTPQRISGVALRGRDARDGRAPGALPADLVVDASGRGSRTPRWLADLGAQPPAEERIDTGLAYATRAYQAGPAPTGDYRAIYLVPTPQTPRSAVVMPTEQPGHYLVTMTGLAGDEPPTDPDGFSRFARRMAQPLVSDWLATAQPLGPPMGHRGTANVRRRYDTLQGPAGLLVVGDAATAFNPIYGQGMSVAAMGARALARALAAGQPSLRRLRRVVRDAGEVAWTISSGADKQMPGVASTAGRPGPVDRLADWYLGRVQDQSSGHPVVAFAFRDVIHLTAPVSVLFSWRVARTVLFGRRLPPPAQPPLYA